MLRPTRTKLRVLALIVATFALYRLIELSPQWVALLSAALVAYALSPLSARREVVYDVEYVTVREPRSKRAEKPAEALVEPDDSEQRIAKLAKQLHAEHKRVMSLETAHEIARRYVESASQTGETLAA
jgi:hypothetical protein